MNGINRTIVAVVSMIALIYSALCFYATLRDFIINDMETIRFYLFFPIDGQIGYSVSDILNKYNIHDFTQYYQKFIDWLLSYNPESMAKYNKWLTLAIIIIGFLIAVAGFLTKEATDVKGRTNPAEYLWTHRPHSAIRALALPWNFITGSWKKSKILVVFPIILLPLYAPWAILITIMIIVPYLICRLIVGGKIAAASRRERRDFAKNTEFSVCPHCRTNFERPTVKCRCGLAIDYPVPNIYGYKYHTCNNGHDTPCEGGKRSELRTFCPNCGEKIVTREAKPIAVSFVGAVGAGKTTMMLAVAQNISQNAKLKGISVELPSESLTKQDISSKDWTPKTVTGELESRCMFLSSSDLRGREILFNDISGEEFRPNPNKILFEEYYNYTDGFVFVFDPMSLKKERLKDAPSEIFSTFHSMYTGITNTSPNATVSVPFAVVASKNDLMSPALKDEDVRQYLIDNRQAVFVQLMESVFKNVKYFAVNSTGDECESAMRPVWWIVGQSDAELVRKVPAE